MSSYTIETHKCFICKSKNQYKVITGHTSFGSQDLDLREPEMQRSTIWWWVEECPVCGYVSVQVDDTTSITRDFLETPAYKTCDGINFKSNRASKFYKQYLICLSDNKLRGAFFALLHAAWVCDDVEDKDNSILCRKKSLPILSEIAQDGPKDKAELRVLKMDVLRRAGLFDDVRTEFAKMHFRQKLLNNIVSYALCIDDFTAKTVRKKTYAEIIAILDKYVSGMKELKERIAEFVISLQYCDIKGFVLLLVGPPGVGKTSIAKAFSEIFEYEYVEIDCSGRNLVSMGGISSIYGGSKPGEIMQKTIGKASTNYVLLLDEIGQMVADDKDGDAYSILGSMLGLQKQVNDRYLPFGISVRNSIIIGTTNNITSIPGYILNRFEDNIFYLPGYSAEDKVNIAQNYVIPEKLAEFKILSSELKFQKDALIEIATNYCCDEGMREMQGYIKSLIRKAITGWDRKILSKPTVIDVDYVKKNLRHNGKTKNKMGY